MFRFQPFQEYLKLIFNVCVNELGFNVPPTTRSYGHGPRFKVPSERPEKQATAAFGSAACYPLHYRRSWLIFMQSGHKSGVPAERRVIFSLQICFSSKPRIPNGDNDHQPRNHLPGSPAFNFSIFCVPTSSQFSVIRRTDDIRFYVI